MPSQTETSQPKLFLRKPSKAELKKFKAEGGRAPPQSPPPGSMDSSSKGTPAELPPKKTFLRRIFPFLLVVNFAVGAYVLLRTTQKKDDEEEIPVNEEKPVPSTSEFTSTLTSPETPQPEALQPVPVPPPRVIPPPIPESQRRELFKWMLEEKRKIKPSSPVEKNKVNEEKALLKKYIRAESIPNL